jgi:butyrate kinase
MCFSGKYTPEEIQKMICGKGGLKAYTGTADVEEIIKKATNGDKNCELVLDAMIYQTAKEIGAMATVLTGKVDVIAITGGIAYCQTLMQKLIQRVKFIAPVKLYPGENEMEALLEGALLSENGKSPMNEYV